MLRVRLVGDKQMAERFAFISEQQEAVIGKALKQAAVAVRGEATKLVYAGHPKHLRGDSNTLKNHIIHQVDLPGRRAIVGVAGDLPYARIHEFGGVIRPKTKSYLWFFIPNEEARATMSPVARRKAAKGKEAPGVWVRTKKVTIPPRPYLGPALDAKRPDIERWFQRAIQRLLGGKP